jgi:uncharacterized protein (TIGR00730 family)
MKRVCVFCGSRCGSNPVYAAAAKELGELLARHGLGLVFGAGNIGLMGVVADAVLAGGGEVIGVIPQALVDKELAHPRVRHMHIVSSMHQRKQIMADHADAFVALPGGFGTCDEFFEIVTWRQLKIHAKPVALLNTNGFFDRLLDWLDHVVDEDFIKRPHRELLIVESTPEALLELILQEPSPEIARAKDTPKP